MMARHWKFAIAVLAVFALIGLINVPTLVRSVLRLKRATVTEEQARRAIVQPSISTPTDTRAKAQLFWASTTTPGSVDPVTVELPLSAEPEQRGKQLIAALIEQAPSPEQRTLPADLTLLQFYLLSDGTAVADFSEMLGTETPSGILSEQMVVDSITRTLGANLSGVTRLKILVRGEETDTLAGHLDLTGFFPVEAIAPPATTPDPASPAATNPAPSPTPAAPALGAPAAAPPSGTTTTPPPASPSAAPTSAPH
jgi:sporulation and spore germination protein